MLDVLRERLKQKKRTSAYPNKPVQLPERFRGKPLVDMNLCTTSGCSECAKVCPTSAITYQNHRPSIDLGKCLFCLECTQACPSKAIAFSNDYRLATSSRSDLVISTDNHYELKKAESLKKEMLRLYGRSLKIRQISAAGCNACEADTNVLGTLFFDLSRFGIQIVASPRHADGILVTGPVSKNMELALKKTYEAVPGPRIVIATGACAISGGVFSGHEETTNGLDSIIPVDLYIPGCPPHPMTILDGLLRLLSQKTN